MPLLFLLLAGVGVAYAVSQSSSPSGGGGKTIDPHELDPNVWAADLAELPDDPPGSGLRSSTMVALSRATAADIPKLQELANTLDQKNFHRAANRVRTRVSQLGGAPLGG